MAQTKPKTVPVMLRMPAVDREALKRRAELTHQSVNSYVCGLLREVLKRHR